ncbi:lipase family protein [Ancylobacter terrae]|uniref:hypothetical protein n=1 Tax=Ancylobacter sp. sgz301288 TaxID=3342077 RepID=UPI003859A68D
MRRYVLLLPGHDPTDMAYHHGRFVNQAGRFAELWGARTQVSALGEGGEAHAAQWSAATAGPNWRTETRYEILRWDDIVRHLDARPDRVRLARGFSALWDFLKAGAAWRYLRTNLRYGLFFFYPFACVALFLAAAGVAGWAGFRLAAPLLTALPAALLGVAIAVAAFFVLFRWPGRRWHLHQALDDWDLARDYLYGRAGAVEARIEALAERLVRRMREAREEGVDEVVLVGHSLGATFAVALLCRALAIDPALAQGPVRLRFLTCGATLPKLAFHPAGSRVREETARVAAMPGLLWAEFQARHDAINFYKVHPVRLTMIAKGQDGWGPDRGSPVIRIVSFKQMLTPRKFRRIRWRMMRIHYQFLLANERRANYDYFMFVLGPVPFDDLVIARDGPLRRFAPDGALLPPPAPDGPANPPTHALPTDPT